MQLQLPVSQEILSEVSKLDRFQGRWSAQHSITPERLRRIREAAHVRSVAASCRLAGIHVTEADVAGLLRGDRVASPDAAQILGYARASSRDPLGQDDLLSGDRLRRLHAEMLGAGESAEPSPWRKQTLYGEAFDAAGQATGQVFPTLPPRLLKQKTEELVTWLEFELRTREQHPVLVIAAFVLALISISPFERGNCLLARLLGSLLLRRAGYSAIPYESLEAQMEAMRDEYHGAIARSQTHLWTDDADLRPWLGLFLDVLGRHRERIEAKMEQERRVEHYPPLQRTILQTVREHGSVDAAMLLRVTGANRNTLKDNLRRLVKRGVLERTGQRRGSRYRMSAGEPAALGASGPDS